MTPPISLAVALGGFGVLLFVAERRFPLRTATRPIVERLVVNAIISALALATATLLVSPIGQTVLGWSAETGKGLVPLLGLSGPAASLAAFLLMDLSFYYWHRANHALAPLWRFHRVHHSDPDLDVTTALRFHFCELGFSAGFRALQIAIIGPSVVAYLVYEAVFQAGTLFQHSNLRLPPAVERALTLVMVTPRMHGIHHSQVERETDSNFSSVLSVWDRLHRSLRLNVPQQAVAIGVPAYGQVDDNGIGTLLRAPFRKQPDHWRRPDGTVPTRDTSALGPSPTRLEP